MRRSLDASDSAALQAALSLIEDCDGDDWLFGPGGEDHETDCASLDDPAPPPTAPPKPARKRHRNRRKDEIAYLRHKVVELERVLAVASARAADEQGVAPPDLELASIWRELARRQRRKRDSSERENAALREMLARHVQVARQLLRFLEGQPRQEDLPGVRVLKRLQAEPVDAVDASHDELVRRMDAQYAQASVVFDHDSAWSACRSLETINVHNGGDTQTATVDIRTAWVVPFELDVVANVLRERCDRSTIQSMCPDFQTLESKDRLLVSLFSGGAENGQHSMEFRGHVVSRDYPEPADTRVHIVSELSVEPLLSPEARLPLYAVHSQGWIRLQPYKLDGESLRSATTQSLTQIQWFRSVRILPRSPDGGSHRQQAGVFTETILAHIRQDLDESQQVIEDLLLKEEDRDQAESR